MPANRGRSRIGLSDQAWRLLLELHSDGQGGSGGAAGGTAGVGGCSAVLACPAIACALGWTSESKPGDCCPTCVPNGQGGVGGSGGAGGCTGAMTCPGLDCVQGYKLEQKAGECCPTCVPNADACTQGQQGYDTLRQKLLQQSGVLGCKVDANCKQCPANQTRYLDHMSSTGTYYAAGALIGSTCLGIGWRSVPPR